MKLLFILDPLDSLKHYKDTSISHHARCGERGHAVIHL
jgi:hypothetical protein